MPAKCLIWISENVVVSVNVYSCLSHSAKKSIGEVKQAYCKFELLVLHFDI